MPVSLGINFCVVYHLQFSVVVKVQIFVVQLQNFCYYCSYLTMYVYVHTILYVTYNYDHTFYDCTMLKLQFTIPLLTVPTAVITATKC